MNASSLLVPSPFGRTFLRAPPWLQETLRHHGFGPHQSDGHVLLHTCLRPAVPEDDLVLEDHPDFVDVGSKVTWNTTFGYILNTALTRMGGLQVHLQMLELLAKVRSGPDPTAYSERQLRWEIVDRERWLNSFIPAPVTDLNLGPINQKVLEGHLRRKWAERLLAHLIPHAGEIAHLAPLRGDNEEQEFHDLLGDTRFRTLRQRCLVLEQRLKWNLPIPWKESNVRELLNRLRAQEVTPHKLQLCWDTLRWFAKKFGLRKNTVFSRRSRPWRQGSPLQWYSQPGKPKYHLKKSFGPWRKELVGRPFFPELIARRKRGHTPQENWTPSSWGLSATRWVAQLDSTIFSTRHHPL